MNKKDANTYEIEPSVTKRLILKNSALLALAQLLNYIVPIVSLPYLTRTLGADTYGTVGLAASLYLAGSIIVDFGFFIAGTAAISERLNDVNYVNHYYTAATMIRVLLTLPAGIIIALVASNSPAGQGHLLFIAIYCLSIAFQAISPVWLFLAMNRLPTATLLIALSKIAFLLVIILCVKSASDLIVIGIGQAITTLLAAIALLYFIHRSGIRFTKIDTPFAVFVFRTSLSYFGSRIVLVIITAGSSLVVGIFAQPAQMAYYAIADQLYRALQGLANSVQQSVFPVVIRTRQVRVVIFFGALLFIPLFLCSVLFYLYGAPLTGLIFGPEFSDASKLIYISLFSLTANIAGTMLSYPLFAALGAPNRANWTFLAGGAFHVVLLGIVIITDSVSAASILFTILTTECFMIAIRISLACVVRRSSVNTGMKLP